MGFQLAPKALDTFDNPDPMWKIIPARVQNQTPNKPQHAEAKQQRTGRNDAVNELPARDTSVAVAVLLAEEVHDPGLVVVHPLQVALAPVVKLKVLQPFHLQDTRLYSTAVNTGTGRGIFLIMSVVMKYLSHGISVASMLNIYMIR